MVDGRALADGRELTPIDEVSKDMQWSGSIPWEIVWTSRDSLRYARLETYDPETAARSVVLPEDALPALPVDGPLLSIEIDARFERAVILVPRVSGSLWSYQLLLANLATGDVRELLGADALPTFDRRHSNDRMELGEFIGFDAIQLHPTGSHLRIELADGAISALPRVGNVVFFNAANTMAFSQATIAKASRPILLRYGEPQREFDVPKANWQWAGDERLVALEGARAVGPRRTHRRITPPVDLRATSRAISVACCP
ncbi:MAG: hypothetical protein ACI8W8_000917 [Rhodothermales bacterium]|jgi:hypothetical protein